MKTLYLIRHSKSTREISLISDIDRPLTERGYRDAVTMSGILADYCKNPDLIMSSPSVRTFSTALIFARTLKYPVNEIVLENKVYEAGSRDLLGVLNKVDDKNNTILIFCHNPGATRFLSLLTGEESKHFSTTAFAEINFGVDSWKMISQGSGTLKMLKQPRETSFI
jgi:phosphohistidine phosphatase